MTKKSEESQLAGKKMESGQEKAGGHEKVTLAEMRFARTKTAYLSVKFPRLLTVAVHHPVL